MGRGRTEIKKIENTTNRQVTYSKRRNGIIKKANELSVLCDAKVSLIMYANSRKLHEYTSPSTTTKKMIDLYQQTVGVDLWSSHYEKMKENLERLKEINNKLRGETRLRKGEDASGLTSLSEMVDLQEKMTIALSEIRERKYHVIKTQTGTTNKKLRNLKERYGNLVHELEMKGDEAYGIVENEEGYSNGVNVFGNGMPNLYALRLHDSHPDDVDFGSYCLLSFLDNLA
ncbi:MADS box transcription factor [Lithospermum erythrorhizon]|uniref:MADS box transcription factor n=1 Tax=Lithospermum erythrorhizon TaxID=34254 RepID=A0AAV3QEC0_LITER